MLEIGDVKLKILIVGDYAVGKTSLLLKYISGFFPEKCISTIGVEYKVKSIDKNNTNIYLEIWDTYYQERYKKFSKYFLKDADGIIIQYDISDKKTFDHIKNWISETENENTGFKKIIVGNKIDLPNDSRQVKKETLEKYCNERNIKGIEVSAKTGDNVENAFNLLTDLIVGNMTKDEIIKKFGIKKKDNIKISEPVRRDTKRKIC